MKNYMLACGGYSAEGKDDLLIVKVNEYGEYAITHSCRQGENPSFCIRKGDYLYTVEEVDKSAAIRAWKIDGDRLEETGMRIQVPGAALCHLCVGGKALFGSSYLTGDYFAVDYELKELLWHRKPIPYSNPENARQECPHAHWAAVWGEQLVLADLGSDRIWRYRMEEGMPVEELPALELEKGAGPRQPMPLEEKSSNQPAGTADCSTAGDDHRNSVYLFSVQELDSTLCLWKKDGETVSCVDKIRTTAKDCDNFPGTMCMADENTVLICNRGANTLSAVRADGDTLTLIGEWETANWPRHLMRVADSNLFVNSCNEAGKAVIFAWEQEKLVKKGEIDLPGASCAALL